MMPLTFDELDSRAVAYDEAVLQTGDIDHFCSSSFWVLPAAEHLQRPARAWVHHAGSDYVVMGRSYNGVDSTVLHPLEAMWALPSPLIGQDPDVLAELYLETLARDASWQVALLTGVGESSRLWQRLVPALSRRYGLSRGPITRRHLVDLREGVDGFLSKRSQGFRRNLRRAERLARRLGVEFEVADTCDPKDADASFDRLLAVERASWKGRGGEGIDLEPMASFYRDMNRRMVERGSRRLVFATLDGEDVAYIFGGVFGSTYRGLQFSFDHRHQKLSLGNLCQLREIERLHDEGFSLYDLGTDVPYKKRWGDDVFATTCLFVHS